MTRPTIPIIGRTEIDAGEKKLSPSERKVERERQLRVREEGLMASQDQSPSAGDREGPTASRTKTCCSRAATQGAGRRWTQLELDRGRFDSASEWFAWRPVRLENGGWAWLTTVERSQWHMRLGDAYFPSWSTYALLP